MSEPFAALTGVELLAEAPGFARTALTVAEHHLNMHGTAHGGAVFALADSAFAAASNAGEYASVALTMSVAYLSPATVGERLLCEAREVHATRRTALYEIRVWAEAAAERDGARADSAGNAGGGADGNGGGGAGGGAARPGERDVARLQAMVYRKGDRTLQR